MDEDASTDRDTDGETRPASAGRTLGLVVGVSALIGLAVAGLVYSVIALPLYVLAQADPDGLDRPFIRRGFLLVALPAGLIVGTGAGLAIGAWYRRGGRLPTDRTDFHDR